MASGRFKTTVRRAVLALLVGATCGVVLAVAWVAASGLLAEIQSNLQGSKLLIPLSLQVWVAAVWSLYFAIGIAGIAAPAWFGIARLGCNGPIAAGLTGFCTTGLVWAAYSARVGGDLISAIASSLPWTVIGAVCGVVTWRAAYRRSPESADDIAGQLR